MNRKTWLQMAALVPATLLLAACGTTAGTGGAATIDNEALGKPEFRAHQTTYGVVYRLPADVTAVLDSKIMPALHSQLVRQGLNAEAQTFNLPHVTVVHLHSADPKTPEKMLAAMPALPPVLNNVHLKNFYTTEAAKGAGKPWWLDLGIVKTGPAFEDMMRFSTRATMALTPLRDGPLPRVTGPVYAKMGDAGKTLVQTMGVSGVNVMQNGQELRAHNPHNTLVYSEAAFSPAVEKSMNEVAAEFNRLLPDGIVTNFDNVSIVELAFSGNVLREIYRISLVDGAVYDVRNGRRVK